MDLCCQLFSSSSSSFAAIKIQTRNARNISTLQVVNMNMFVNLRKKRWHFEACSKIWKSHVGMGWKKKYLTFKSQSAKCFSSFCVKIKFQFVWLSYTTVHNLSLPDPFLEARIASLSRKKLFHEFVWMKQGIVWAINFWNR